MDGLIILVFVLFVANMIRIGFILVKNLIPHWETVLAKKYSLPKYEFLELVDRKMYRRPFGPWKLSIYKRDCEDINEPPKCFMPLLVHNIIGVVLLIAWIVVVVIEN